MGLIAFSFGGTWISDWPVEAGIPIGGLATVVGVVAMVRGVLYRVVLADDTMTVKGYLWSRKIPKSAIRSVTRFPAVRWRDETGRMRWSPLVGFMQGNTLPFVERRSEGGEAELRRWLRKGHSGRH